VYFCESDLKPITASVFWTKSPTVFAGNICEYSRVVQIHPFGILVIDTAGGSGKKVQEMPIGDELQRVKIVQAVIQDPYMLLRMSDGSVQFLSADNPDRLLSVSYPNFLNIAQRFPQFENSVCSQILLRLNLSFFRMVVQLLLRCFRTIQVYFN
jgi:hypothetical protein